MPLRLVPDPKTGIWQIRGTQILPGQPQGVRVRESARTTDRREAERFLEATRARILEDAERGPAGAYTFADAAEFYIEKGGETRFLRPLVERFGDVRIADLTETEVSRFAAERFGHLQASTIKRHYYTPLNAVIAASADRGLCPAKVFAAPRVIRQPAKWASDAHMRTLAPHLNGNLIGIVAFMQSTSARVTEACNLVAGDVNLDQRTALLRKTKNGKPRLVMLSDWVCRDIAARIAGKRPTDRVYAYSSRFTVNNALERAARRAGVEYLSSHEIGRHTFAARFLAQGHSLLALQVAGGWATIKIVADTYGHLEQSHVQDAVRGTGEWVGLTLEGAGRPDKLLTNDHERPPSINV